VTPDDARAALTAARSATLGTVTAGGEPHLVPCCFALDGDTAYSAVDAKPKSTLALRRLDNIRARPRACLLADHFTENWSRLWWVRADGAARVIEEGPERERAIDLLIDKYPQYRERRPEGAVIAIDIDGWRSWAP
jgi:PPOX class probable F420-dependent enzyme